MSWIENQSCNNSLSRSFYIEVLTLPLSGSDQASAVGCKGVVKVPWFLR